MIVMQYRIYNTMLLGLVGAAGSPEGLVTVTLGATAEQDLIMYISRKYPGCRLSYNDLFAEGFFRQLDMYLQGERTSFDYPYDLTASGFTRRVLEQLSTIPYGHVRTYRDLALQVGSPQAARAVGQACKRNPLPLLLPCHRVVASHGIGGFSPGLEYKRILLGLEKAVITN